MVGRRSVLGVSTLCALVLGVFAAANAFGAQRAWECAPTPGSGTFTDEHCQIEAGTGFTHKNNIANGTPTNITGTNQKTAAGTTASEVWKLKGKLVGVATEVQCTTLASVSNAGLINEANAVIGNGKAVFSGCTVAAPAGRNCKVGGGEFTTSELFGSTAGLSANELKIEPFNAETELTVIRIENCLSNIPPTNNYPVDGSLIFTTSGATMTSTHAGITAQGTLTFGGNPAGVSGAATIRMEGGNALSLT
jgi:hypothetical protein